MNLLSISLLNFLSHVNTKVTFDDGLTAIIGKNGSGKSSLMVDAVLWGLWGKSRSGGAGDELIRDGEPYCAVCITFEVNGQEYVVTRERRRGAKTVLTLGKKCVEAGELSGATVKDTQATIDLLLGMSYDLFINSCCIEQGNIESFSTLTPAESSRVLRKVLKIERYDTYRESAMTRLSDVSTRHLKALHRLDDLRSQLLQARNFDGQKNDVKTTVNTLRTQKDKLESDLSAAKVTYSKLEKTIGTKASLLATEKSSLQSLTDQMVRVGTYFEEIEKTTGKCPVCRTLLFGKKKTKTKESLLKECEVLADKKLIKLSYITALEKELSELGTQLRACGVEVLTDKLRRLETDLSGRNAELDTLSKTHRSAAELEQLCQDQQLLVKRLEEEKVIYTELVQSFGSKGIPLLIIDYAMRELQILINDNLSVLSELPISVEICTQREASDGTSIDTFQIFIRNGLSLRPYTNYSGGEKTIIDLSIRLGLSELLARRNNFKLETLVIDEGLGTLDDDNQHNLADTLVKLSSKLKKIIVITHTSAKDYFKNRIQIYQKNGISCVAK